MAETIGQRGIFSLWTLGRPYIWGEVEHWGESDFRSLLEMSPLFSRVFSAWLTLDSTLKVGAFFNLMYVSSSSRSFIFFTYSVRSITTVTLPLLAGRMTISVSFWRSLMALRMPPSRSALYMPNLAGEQCRCWSSFQLAFPWILSPIRKADIRAYTMNMPTVRSQSGVQIQRNPRRSTDESEGYPTPAAEKSVVYKIPCKDCGRTYISEQ